MIVSESTDRVVEMLQRSDTCGATRDLVLRSLPDASRPTVDLAEAERENVVRTYAIRLQAVTDPDRELPGCRDMLGQLAAESETSVWVGAVSSHEFEFTIFLNHDRSRLIGCVGVATNR